MHRSVFFFALLASFFRPRPAAVVAFLTRVNRCSTSLSLVNDDVAQLSSSFRQTWYSDPAIERDRTDVLKDSFQSLTSGRFVVIGKEGMLHQNCKERIAPVYLSETQVNAVLTDLCCLSLQEVYEAPDPAVLLAWVGSHENQSYWVIRCGDDKLDTSLLPADSTFSNLREFGDRLEHRLDAGILATANGLVEFHISHGFCSRCGSKTVPRKAGACRQCTSSSGCGRSVYPRLDVATIMLITSACGQYSLMGRKAGWPKGRYSTLAGFAEVGETLEECCARETLEESGVQVDRNSIAFVASQPWPFPRSLMVGFQAKALPASSSKDDELPTITVQPEEMEDIQWFSKDFVKERLQGGSTALGFVPNAAEAEFHIPGKSSLARLLITRWTEER